MQFISCLSVYCFFTIVASLVVPPTSNPNAMDLIENSEWDQAQVLQTFTSDPGAYLDNTAPDPISAFLVANADPAFDNPDGWCKGKTPVVRSPGQHHSEMNVDCPF